MKRSGSPPVNTVASIENNSNLIKKVSPTVQQFSNIES